MKWLFLLMVAVNIAIYIWGVQRETVTETLPDPRYSDIGEIKLLSKDELEPPSVGPVPEIDNIGERLTGSEQQSFSVDNLAIPDASGIEPDPEVVAAPDTSDTESGLEKVAAPDASDTESGLEEVAAPDASDTEFGPEVVATLDATDKGPASEVELPGEPEKADVVNSALAEEVVESSETELSPEELTAPEMAESEEIRIKEAETPEVESAVVQEVFCRTLGPVALQPDALAILEIVEEKVDSTALREEAIRNITGYWVLLPPYENARAAREVVKQLRSRDISDVQRFYRGEFENGVSLGIYNQRFNAEKRRKQIESKGFYPEVIPRFKEVPEYWIDYQSESEVDILVEIPPVYRDLRVIERECDELLN